MFNLKNKTVFITGASSGIGKACAEVFAESGANLILSARRVDKIKELADKLSAEFNIEVFAGKMDVQKRKEIDQFVNKLPDNFKKIDILVNNAGLALGVTEFYNDDPDGWDTMIDTNIKGLLYTTHKIVPLMMKEGAGHVINLGSIAGHQAYPKGSVYCATKHAVKAITRSLRMDLLDQGIRVSSVDPGMVETEFSEVRFRGDKDKASDVYKGIEPLVARDIAEAILFCATRPPHANINEMVIMPSAQANAFITHRKD